MRAVPSFANRLRAGADRSVGSPLRAPAAASPLAVRATPDALAIVAAASTDSVLANCASALLPGEDPEFVVYIRKLADGATA
jgi:hypothetical protein